MFANVMSVQVQFHHELALISTEEQKTENTQQQACASLYVHVSVDEMLLCSHRCMALF